MPAAGASQAGGVAGDDLKERKDVPAAQQQQQLVVRPVVIDGAGTGATVVAGSGSGAGSKDIIIRISLDRATV